MVHASTQAQRFDGCHIKKTQKLKTSKEFCGSQHTDGILKNITTDEFKTVNKKQSSTKVCRTINNGGRNCGMLQTSCHYYEVSL